VSRDLRERAEKFPRGIRLKFILKELLEKPEKQKAKDNVNDKEDGI